MDKTIEQYCKICKGEVKGSPYSYKCIYEWPYEKFEEVNLVVTVESPIAGKGICHDCFAKDAIKALLHCAISYVDKREEPE